MKKDFDARTYAGILVGYGEEKIGYEVYLPEADKIVTSAHVLFDETLPAPPTGYHAEHEELARIKVAPGEDRTVQSYYCILNTCQRDDEDNLLYQVTRLAISK